MKINYLPYAVTFVASMLFFIGGVPKVSPIEAWGADKKKAEESVSVQEETEQFEIVTVHTCKSNISYSWTPGPDPQRRNQSPPSQKIVPFTTIEAEDTVEDEARKKAADLAQKAQATAITDCKATHENEALCIAYKMKSLGSSYEMADFSIKKALLESLKEDCRKVTGECGESKYSDIECVGKELKVPKVVTPAEQDDKEKKGSDKKKK